MKVLCVIETMGLGGGAERLLVSLVPELARRGIDVEVVTLFDCDVEIGTELERLGHRVHQLHLRQWNLPHGVAQLRQLIVKHGFSVVWGHLYFGNLYALAVKSTLPRVRGVITVHSAGYDESALGWRAAARRIIERHSGKHVASTKVAVSRTVADTYAQQLGWDNMYVIYNGIPVSEIRARPIRPRQEVRAAFDVPMSAFAFVVPSRFVKTKGHALLIQAVAQLAQRGALPHVIALGGGPLLSELRAETARLGLSSTVRFHEPVEHDGLLDLMAACDAAVLPSLREPFGIAAAEAMAVGIPVVLSATDGLLELASDGESALLVAPASASSLADGMLAVMEAPDLRRKLVLAASQRVLRFDIGACADRWADLLRSDGGAVSDVERREYPATSS